MFHRVKHILHRISYAGVQEDLPHGLSERIILTNQLALTIVPTVLVFTFIFSEVGSKVLTALTLATAITYALTIVFNSFRCLNLSRAWLILTCNIMPLIYCLFVGEKGGIQIYYFASVAYPLVILEAKEIKLTVASLILPISLYLVLSLISFDPWLDLSSEALSIISAASAWVTFLSLVAAFIYFSTTVSRTQEQLEASVDNLKKENILRKSSEERLSLNEGQLRSIFDSAEDVIILLDQNLRVVEVNKEPTNFGFTSRQLIGKCVDDFGSVIDVDFFRKTYQRVIDTGKPVRVEHRCKNISGAILWLSINASPVFDARRNVIAVTSISRDITPLKNKEEELRIAKDSAVAANLAKTAFLANMSHEIRTPLGAIMGFIELLSQPRLGQADREKASIALQKNCQMLMKLINEILDLSKVEYGKVELQKTFLPLRSAVEDVVLILQGLAESKNLKIKTFFDSSTPASIFTDANRLRQILVNLIGNAIKFTSTGVIQVSTSVVSASKAAVKIASSSPVGEANLDPTEVLVISISDTGTGIAPEYHNQIFESFQQGPATYVRSNDGSGLGLAISRQLAKALGGRLELTHSVPGKGSVFSVFLPLVSLTNVTKLTNVANVSHLHTDGATAQSPNNRSAEDFVRTPPQSQSQSQSQSRSSGATSFDGDPMALRLPISELNSLSDRSNHRSDGSLESDCNDQGGASNLSNLSNEVTTDENRKPDPHSAAFTDVDKMQSKFAEKLTVLSPLDLDLAAPQKSLEVPNESSASASLAQINSVLLENRKILLVEDYPDNRVLISHFLKTAGAQVECAENGQQAIDMVLANCFDVILMDIQLPIMDGYQATEKIRSLGCNTPIVAITAYAMQEERDRCIAKGCNGYLSKPLKRVELISAIVNTLKLGRNPVTDDPR